MCKRQQKKWKDIRNAGASNGMSSPPLFMSKSRSGTTGGSYASSLPSDRCRYFSFTEIRAATNDFDESLLLGVGGFGKYDTSRVCCSCAGHVQVAKNTGSTGLLGIESKSISPSVGSLLPAGF
ncbi:hypothetical protein OPV22_013279 [Ensete ventricosum]|uniref:Uncharacterized protein n=1 Tax=Ensete ventricosum TaxID=4639 RepID=A0AAV8PIE5_ENSVE|nr:hypothetical protein OPV22_013279 [Ensete ventricosum]